MLVWLAMATAARRAGRPVPDLFMKALMAELLCAIIEKDLGQPINSA